VITSKAVTHNFDKKYFSLNPCRS